MGFRQVSDEGLARQLAEAERQMQDAHAAYRQARATYLDLKHERDARAVLLPPGSASVLLQPVDLSAAPAEDKPRGFRLFRRGG